MWRSGRLLHVDESDIDREESREELSGYEGPRGVKCGSM